MATTTHLADTSVLTRIAKPVVRASMTPMLTQGRIALCSPVTFELGFTAQSAEDYELLMDRLSGFDMAPVTEGDHRRSLEVQRELSARGRHRGVSLTDALVAAVAESRNLSVLHYDSDFELIAAITGQPQVWVVPRGTAD